MLFKSLNEGAPGGLSRLSVQLSVSAQAMIPRSTGWSPVSGPVLTVQSLLEILSLSISLSLNLSLSLSSPPPFVLSEINKYEEKKQRLHVFTVSIIALCQMRKLRPKKVR